MGDDTAASLRREAARVHAVTMTGERGRRAGTAAIGVIVGALLLGAALVAASYVAIKGVEYVKTYDSSRLDVTGSADRVVTSDQVKWQAAFARRVGAAELSEGYRSMTNDLDTVLSVLAEQGFTRDALSIQPVSVSPVYRQCYNVSGECVSDVVGYELNQYFTLSSDRVDDVTALAQDAQPFVDAGLSYQTVSLEYYYSGLAAVRPQLLAEAITDAKRRAEAVADATGVRVGQLRSADSGVFQVTQLNSTEVSAYGVYDTSTIEKRVTAVVHASFALR